MSTLLELVDNLRRVQRQDADARRYAVAREWYDETYVEWSAVIHKQQIAAQESAFTRGDTIDPYRAMLEGVSLTRPVRCPPPSPNHTIECLRDYTRVGPGGTRRLILRPGALFMVHRLWIDAHFDAPRPPLYRAHDATPRLVVTSLRVERCEHLAAGVLPVALFDDRHRGFGDVLQGVSVARELVVTVHFAPAPPLLWVGRRKGFRRSRLVRDERAASLALTAQGFAAPRGLP